MVYAEGSFFLPKLVTELAQKWSVYTFKLKSNYVVLTKSCLQQLVYWKKTFSSSSSNCRLPEDKRILAMGDLIPLPYKE